mmetsp:Transcript_14412/g.31170  ORF Transcript_14412/g.31170 Transcript_14412/m.31170 type:complete len:355 (+) Transcript_14412:83-1147(+)
MLQTKHCPFSGRQPFGRLLVSHNKPQHRLSSYAHLKSRIRSIGEEAADNSGSQSSGLLTASINVVQDLLHSLSQDADSSRLDCFLSVVPDDVLDKAIAVQKQLSPENPEVRMRDILGLISSGDIPAASLSLDSYAERLLIYSAPKGAQMLSSMLPSPDRSLHRYLVTSGTGEQAALTFNLHLQDSLVGQYRMSPRIEKLWRLRAISGEAADLEPPLSAHPAVAPEMVVAAQLEALRQENIAGVYQFASPMNKAQTGPLERFAQLLSNPMYRPLLGHSKHESLRKMQVAEDAYAEVVAIMSNNTGLNRTVAMIYLWSLAKVPASSPEDAGCWMTSSVQLISAHNVTKWPPPPSTQ